LLSSQFIVTFLLHWLVLGGFCDWEHTNCLALGVNAEKGQHKWLGSTALGVDDRGTLSGLGRSIPAHALGDHTALERSSGTEIPAPLIMCSCTLVGPPEYDVGHSGAGTRKGIFYNASRKVSLTEEREREWTQFVV
jgi:hypothetical protein